MRSAVLESWRRSERAGVERTPESVEFRRVPEDELQRRLEANGDWLAIARPHLEWLTATFSHIPHVVYLTDRHGIVLHSVGSEHLIETVGLAPGHDWSETTMGTNGAGTALATNQPVAVVGPEHFISSFDDCTCTAAPIHSPDGALVGTIDISTSVADGSPERLSIVAHAAYAIGRELAYERQEESLRQVEHSLRESEDRLRAILDNTSALVYLVDHQGRFIHINRRWQDVFGLNHEQVVGRSIGDFFPQQIADQFRENNCKVLETGATLEVEEAVLLDDGLHTYVTAKVPICDPSGNPRVICGISTDITDRKRVEQEREQTLATLNNLVASAPLGIALLDSEMRYRLINEPLAEMDGVPVEDHLGKTMAQVVPDIHPQAEPIFRRVLKTG